MKNLNSPNFPNSSTPLYVYIDEAWRGPIAGPVTVGLVIGSESTDRSWYADSKSLTARQRELLADKIKSDPSIIRATGSASAKEIDRNGIIWALRWAAIRGLYTLIHKSQIITHNPKQPKQCYRKKLIHTLWTLQTLWTFKLIIDWNHTFWLDTELWITVQTIIKWDRDVPQISAASILAKTTRDHEMINFWATYPWYEFEQHMWYGTAKHYQAIKTLWLCEIHRKKWIKIC
jgi:ribonuclease HII